LSSEKSDIYEKLQIHLDNMPIGYPKTESGIELSLLKKLFSPEEAMIAIQMNFLPESLKKIQRRLKKMAITLESLEKKLDKMFDKGTIILTVIHGEKSYANVPLVVGMYEFQLGRLNQDLVNDTFQYFKEAYFEKEYNKTNIPQLRTIPIEHAITPDLSVAIYDQIRYIILNSDDVIGLMDCICRKAHDLIGDPCKTTNLRKTCLTFGSAARMFNAKGEAEFISKEEALAFVKKMEEEGLVPQPSNSQKPFVICNCCGCYCEVLTNQKRFKEPAILFATNFYAKVDPDLCIGCGKCEERCNMEAIEIVEEKSKINLARCIGCGVCVPTCPKNAISLIRKEKEIVPPLNTAATYAAIMDKKAEIARKEKVLNT
jgi:electron transport complex protein RnfB